MSTRNDMSPTNAASSEDARPGKAQGEPSRATARRRSKVGRRVRSVAGLVVGLVLAGPMYSAFTPAQAASDASTDSAAVAAGQALYERSCITCHGSNLQGVPKRGPSLIGVGAAAVYFQVHTGRMPLARQEAEAQQKPPVFSEAQTEQLAAYVQANGGGPGLPTGELRAGDVASGGELFRLNCASCHNTVGAGGALSSGKAAPSLENADDMTIWTAMLSGPENMPVFGDNQITPDQKAEIVKYVQTIKSEGDPGGAGIGRIGPVSEGLVIWVVAIGALLFGIFWMGSKA